MRAVGRFTEAVLSGNCFSEGLWKAVVQSPQNTNHEISNYENMACWQWLVFSFRLPFVH